MILAFGNKNTLVSYDNGVSWKIWGDSISDVFIIYKYESVGKLTVDERWIAGTENSGIIYSDDKGITWNKTNIVDGSWGNFCKNNDKNENGENIRINAYASSFEDKGVYTSTDAGLNWYPAISTGGNWEIKVIKDGDIDNIVVVGEDGAFVNNEIVSPLPCKIIDNKIVPKIRIRIKNEDKTGFNMSQIEQVTTYILNNILYPFISMKFTGYKNFPLGTIEENNRYNRKKINIKTKEEYYKTFSFISLIDWEKDLGMSKIGDLTLNDILQSDDDNDYIIDTIEGITESNYLKTIKKVKSISNEIRDKVMVYLNNEIENITPDGINEIIENSEEDLLDNDLKAFSFYVDTAKKSAETLTQNIVNNLYTFSEYGLRQITRDALYEMTKDFGGIIKFAIIKEVEKGEEFFDVFDLELKVNFRNSVIKSLKKYAIDMKNNTKVLMNDKDKDIIKRAASFYSYQERPSLIEKTVSLLRSNIENFNYSDITMNYNICVNDVDTFIAKVKNATTIQEVEEIYNNYDFLYKKYNFEKINEYGFGKLYKEFSKSLNTIEFRYLTEDYYNERLKNLSSQEMTRYMQYSEEIQNKFKSRCKELLLYVYKKNNIKDSLASEGKQIIFHQTYEIEQWINKIKSDFNNKIYLNEYNCPRLNKQVESKTKKLFIDIINDYTTQKDII